MLSLRRGLKDFADFEEVSNNGYGSATLLLCIHKVTFLEGLIN